MHKSNSGDTTISSRTLILDTAARLFRNKGYAATTLRDIAALCHMKAGSIYYHFDSKDAIVSEVLRIGVAQVYDEVKRVTTELGDKAESRELIRVAVVAHMKALHDAIDYSSANIRIFGQVPRDIQKSHIPLRKSYEDYWAHLIERCAAAGALSNTRNLRLAQFLLLGAMNSTLEWFQPNKMSVEEVAGEITDLFLYGVGTPSIISVPTKKSTHNVKTA